MRILQMRAIIIVRLGRMMGALIGAFLLQPYYLSRSVLCGIKLGNGNYEEKCRFNQQERGRE